MSAAVHVPPMPLPIRGEALQRLLPHRGSMCLLEAVVAATESAVTCRASGHRAPDHPLRVAGRLQAVAAIEYAAQAMAVHGGLGTGVRGGAPEPGRLVAVRDVRLHADRLDDVTEDLEIVASRVAGDPGGLVYAFSVSAGGRLLAEGRAVVMLARPPA
jgi:predicted hotdog family 3-hydroxylacyl-ACP dehydratase